MFLEFNNSYISSDYSIIGPKEKNSKINCYDEAMSDYYFNCKSFETAEIKMQNHVVNGILEKENKYPDDIDAIVGGDLINQISVSSYNASNFSIPFLGMYSACSTFTEELIISSLLTDSMRANNIICLVSSHNLTAERQFRFPIEYGVLRPSIATSTATASVGCLVTNKKRNIKIISATVGKVIDMGTTDVNHMGAVMAPACANTIYTHLKNSGKTIKDYDLILTGDLGSVGVKILKEFYEKEYHDNLYNLIDAGSEIYYKKQDMLSGGSGPSCLPLFFFNKVLGKKSYKKILLVGSGSLHNTTFVNQKLSIPSISHAVEIEVTN